MLEKIALNAKKHFTIFIATEFTKDAMKFVKIEVTLIAKGSF